MIGIAARWYALKRVAGQLPTCLKCPPARRVFPPCRVADDRFAHQRARVGIGTPEAAGEKTMRRIEMKIQTRRSPFFPGPMRESRRGHRLIRCLILSKAHVAIDSQKRSAGRLRIGNELLTDRTEPGTKVLDESQEGIAHESLIAPFVLLKPRAVVMLAELFEEYEQLRREVGLVLHRN